MDFHLDADAEAFQQELRTWLEANVPSDPMPADPDEGFHYRRIWQKKCTRPVGPVCTGPKPMAGVERR